MAGLAKFGGFGLGGDACGIKTSSLANNLSSNLVFVGEKFFLSILDTYLVSQNVHPGIFSSLHFSSSLVLGTVHQGELTGVHALDRYALQVYWDCTAGKFLGS